MWRQTYYNKFATPLNSDSDLVCVCVCVYGEGGGGGLEDDDLVNETATQSDTILHLITNTKSDSLTGVLICRIGESHQLFHS